jgi:uncharacterized caspase-like protein
MKVKLIIVSIILLLVMVFACGCIFLEKISTITSPSLKVNDVRSVTYWAVIVGIEDYESINDLSYTIDDAEDMSNVLVSYENWDIKNIHLLTDSDASKIDIESAIANMVGSAGEDDVCLFFFSGHGSRIPDEDGDEGKSDHYDEVICPYDTTGYLENVISDDELGGWLSICPGNVVVILDTCMSGGFVKGVEGTIKTVPNPRVSKDAIAKKHFGEGLVERLKQRPISRDLNQAGYVVLMACKESKSAYESPILGNGVFTYYIEEGLQGHADANSDKNISAEEDFYYADPLVRQYKPINQDPQIWDGYGGELPLVIALTPVTGNMYVESIIFSEKEAGPNNFLYITFEVLDDSDSALADVRVEMDLEWTSSDGTNSNVWYYADDTDVDGKVKFTLKKAPSGSYIATVTGLVLTGYEWDEDNGVTSNSHTL